MKYHALLTMPVLCLAAFLAGCASAPIRPDTERSVVFQKPMEIVRPAAIKALVALGCVIKQNVQTSPGNIYVEGSRKRKGFFISTGGERIGVWLESLENGSTRVLANSSKSYVGMLAQRLWDADVLIEMKKALGIERKAAR